MGLESPHTEPKLSWRSSSTTPPLRSWTCDATLSLVRSGCLLLPIGCLLFLRDCLLFFLDCSDGMIVFSCLLTVCSSSLVRSCAMIISLVLIVSLFHDCLVLSSCTLCVCVCVCVCVGERERESVYVCVCVCVCV